MVAAAAAAVARHLCSDDDDGDDKRAKARSPPPPSVHCGAPFFARGCCCGGGGGRSDAARSWRRRPPLAVPCSLPRSVVVLPPLQHELVAAADSLAVVLPALQHELVPAHDSLRLLADADADPCCPALPCSALLGHCPPRPAPAFESPRPPDTATRSVSRGASQERRGPTACVGGCAASGELRRADGPWPRRQALAASSVLQAAAGSVGLLAGAPSRRLPDRARSPPCLPVCGPSLSCLESAALLLVNQQPARPSPGQPARSLTTLRHVRPSCRLATSLAAEPATRRRAGLEGRGKDRCCCRSDIPLWLWRTAAAALSCLVVAIAAPGTGGAGGHKNRKKEQRVGGALFCAGPPATRGPPSAEQEPMGSTLRSRRGAGCCPSFLHSAQLTAAEPCASPCLPPLSAWATAR